MSTIINDNRNTTLEELTRTLLYEGYSLYPYRSSAPKNKTPIPFGMIYPEMYCAYNKYMHGRMQTECIIKGKKDSLLDISVKFLQVNNRDGGWTAVEREVKPGKMNIKNLLRYPVIFPFRRFEKKNMLEEDIYEAIEGLLTVKASAVKGKENAFRLTIIIENKAPVKNPKTIKKNEIFKLAFVSTHTIISVNEGEFISDQNPAKDWKAAVKQCKNENTWPVLFDKTHNLLLSSPIILYDYPQINSESKGDLFDSTEMEEALWLHVNVMTDEEKQKALLEGDQKILAMINKANQLTPGELTGLHDKMKRAG